MKAKQRFISLLLAFLMIVPNFGNFTYVKAFSEEKSATELKGEVKNGIKLFTIDKSIIENMEPDISVERGATIYENSLDHTPLRADGTENYNTVVNLTTIGINGTDFDWSVFNGDKFTVYFYNTKNGQRTEISSATFTKDSNNQLKTNVDWPIDTNSISGFQLGTDFDGNYDVRAELREVNTNTTQGILEFDITIYELPNTNIKVQYNNIYGKPLTENLPSEEEADDLPSFKLDLITEEALEDGEEAPEIKLPRTSTTVNIRNFEQVKSIFGEDATYALSDAGSTDSIFLNKQTHLPITIDKKDQGDFTVGTGDSAKKYFYTIDTGNKANPATITMVYDADVAVPPHNDDGNGPVPVPNGYVRLTFDAKDITNNIEGKITFGEYNGGPKSYIDVKQGVQYDNNKLQDLIKNLTAKGSKEVNGETTDYAQNTKKPWVDSNSNPVPKTGVVSTATYNALYTILIAEQVQKAGGLYPRDFGVFKGTDVTQPKFWKDGVEVSKNVTEAEKKTLIEGFLNDQKTKFEDLSERSTDNEVSNPTSGEIKVTFSDDSFIVVNNQKLYVWDNIIEENEGNKDIPKPKNAVTVEFAPGEHGRLSGTTKYLVNPDADVELTAPTVKADYGYRQKAEKDAWSPEFKSPAKYTTYTKHIAQYEFTKDIVPINPGEDEPEVPANYVTVTFKQGDHGTIDTNQITSYKVNPEKEVDLIGKAPTVVANADYKHLGWDKELKAQFTTDTNITATYKKKVVTTDPNDNDYVKVDFTATGQGNIKQGETSTYWVLKNETVELKGPAVETKNNYAFEKWDPAIQTSYAQDTTHKAVFKYNGNNVVPQPGNDKPNVPADFVKVKFNPGENGKFEQDATTTYWVKPNTKVTVTAPKVTANDDYKHVAWTYGTKEETNLQSVTDTFASETTITAKYLKKVLEEEPTQDQDAYVKVTFNAGTNGTLPENQTEKAYWVLKDTPVTLTAPTVTANKEYKFIQWNPAVQTSYSEDTTHNAQYKKIIEYTDPKDKDYVKVTFDPGTQGKIKEGDKAELWVLKDESVDPKVITPELEVNTGYAFKQWNPAVKAQYTEDTKHIAEYTYNGDDVVPQNPGENKPNVPGNFVKVEFKPGVNGTIANTETAIYWVNPDKQVTLTGPKVTANDEYKHVAWTYSEKTTTGDNATTSVTDTFAEATDITAKYLKKVVTEEPQQDKDAYVKVIFKADADEQTPARGALDGTTTYWVLKNTDVNLTAPTVTPNKGLKFKEWSPAVKNQYDTNTTHTAQYEEKAKVVTENPNDTDYIKVIFNANGGTFGTQTVKEVWVLNGIATFKDASDKVGTPTNETATFKEWKDKATGGTKVDETKTSFTADETFYATWTGKDKIIDVNNPSVDPTPEGYVRLTFDATENGTIGTGQDAPQTKAIDVLKGTEYRDTDLVAKIKEIEDKVTPKDATKKFNAWDPVVPTTGNVSEQKYEAKYVDKNKIIDVDDTTTPVPQGYVRLTFDAKEGTIDGQKTKTIDVLSSLKYSDKDLQDKIASIKAIPTDNTKKFNAWNPSVPADETQVVTAKYEASYVDKDKIIDVVDPKVDPKEGYVRLTFDATTEGAIEGNRNKAIDVLSSVKYNDTDLQNKIASIKAVPHDKTKIFDKWEPAVPTDGTQVTTQTYTAQYKAKDKIIDVEDTTKPTPDGYVRLTFDAKEGTIGTEQTKAIDVLKGTEYRDADLVAKIKEIEDKVTPKDATKKFNAWDPVVPTTGNVSEQTYTAKYVDKNKIIDVDDTTTPVPAGYVRLTFDAKEGTIDGQTTKTIDVLSSLKYSDKDLQDKIASIKAIPTDNTKKFNAWNPAVPADETPVATATYEASYVDKDKIIGVVDPKVDPKEGYVRLTFDATTEGAIDGNRNKAIDVLASVKYSDTDLQNKIASIKAVPHDKTKIFDKWTPDVPTDETQVTTQTYTAQYKAKGKIIDVVDTTKPAPEGYVRLTFDATENGTIGTEQTKAIDVLKGTEYRDADLVAKIKEIEDKVTPKDVTKKFNAWSPVVPTTGNVSEQTFEAKYVDNRDIIPETNKDGTKNVKPEGYVTVRFLVNKNGTLTGETVYFVNPTANVTIDKITAPTITASSGYEIATPQWKPDLSNDTTPIKENRYYVANFSTAVVDPTEFEINYISGNPDEGNVNPSSEKVAVDENAANEAGRIKGSEATANTGFKFVKWINEEGKEVSTDAKFTPTDRKSATYIAVFEKETPTPPVTPTDGKLTITKKLETAPVRPMMQLFRASGEPIKFKFSVTGPNGYSQEFELAAGASNTLENLTHGEYTVREIATQGYTPFYSLENGQETQAAEFKVTINGDNKDVKVTVTNKNIVNPNDLTIRATKVWVGGPKSDHTAVELKLNRISSKTGSTVENVTSQYKVEVTNDNTSDTITYVWSNLPKHDSEGYEYTYSIEELGVGVDKIYTINGNSYKSQIAPDTVNTANETIAFTITNTYQVQQTDNDIVGTKSWVDVPADLEKPTIKLELWRKSNNSAVEKVVDAKELQNDQANFGKQDKTDQNGNDYTYFVKEVNESGQPFNHANYNSVVNGLTVTNTYKSDPIPEPEEYLAIFNGNGGDPVTQRTKVKDGEVITGIIQPTRDGYTFVKWVKAGTGKEFDITKPFSKDILDKDQNSVMFTAVWEKEDSTPEPKPEAEEYLAVFNGNGGTPATQSKTVKDGEVITGITQPTRDGYTFVKWVKAGTSKEFDINKPFSKDILDKDQNSVMVTAVWEKEDSTPEPKPEAEEYLAVFNGNGGTPATQSKTVKDGEVITGITQPTRDGYTFVKWVKAGTGIEFDINQPFSKDYLDSDNSVMFTAVWEKNTTPSPQPQPDNTFTIRYVPNDSMKGYVNPSSEIVKVSSGVIHGSTATARPGYRFLRWEDAIGNTVSTNPTFIPRLRQDALYTAIFADIGATPRPTPTPQPSPSPSITDRPIHNNHVTRVDGLHVAYMFGYVDGTLRPNASITRAEAAALVARLSGLPMVDESKPNFPDVDSGWHNTAINAVVKAGFMQGYPDGTFKPYAPISRSEFTQLVSKLGPENSAVAPFEDVRGNWAENVINRAYGNGWLDGYPDGTFRPNNEIQRAEVVKILNKIFNRNVGERGIQHAQNPQDVHKFSDLVPTHWAYYELIEATNTHEYQRIEPGKVEENWIRILGK